MATQADGSIVIQADLETKKAQDELNSLEKQIKQMNEEQAQAQKELAAAAKETTKAKQDLQKKTEALTQAESKVAAMEEHREPLIRQAEELRAKMRDATEEVQKYKQAWLSGVGGADIDETAARERLSGIKEEYDSILQKIEKEDQAIERANIKVSEQAEAVQRAKSEWEKANLAEQTAKDISDGISEAIEKAETRAGELAERLSEAGDAGGDAGNRISEAMAQAEQRMKKFEKRVIGLAKRVFVFTLITKALRSLKDYLWENIQTSAEAQAAIAKLRGALLTLAQPLVNGIIPAFTRFVELLAKLAATAARLTSRLFGTTVEESAKQAEEAQNARDALKGQSKAMKDSAKAAKEAQKQFAGFDEIEQLTADHTEDLTDALGEEAETGNAPDFQSVIGNQLDGIAELFVGLALVALGAILTFSGANIPLGIGLMIIGALTVWDAVSENWDAISGALQGPLGAIMGILSTAALVIGAILTFSGANIPLGIALMVIGAAGLATVVAVNWNALSSVLQGPIGILTGVLSAAALVIGAILALSGVNIPLGIGLLAAGAVGLITTAAANTNWSSLTTVLQGPIGTITTIVSGALLAVGALMAFSGFNIPLGIALIAAGAVSLVTTSAINWNATETPVKAAISTLMRVVGGALLALGALFAFTGVNIPLGIGFLVAGAASLGVSAVVVNWDSIVTALQGPLGLVVGLVSGALVALGVILLFTGAGIPLGLGLIVAGAVGLAASIAPNWDWIVEKLKSVWDAIAKGVTTAWNGITGFLEKTWQNITKGISTAWDGVKTFFTNFWSNLGNAFTRAGEGIKNGLSSLWTAITNGVRAAWNGIWGIIKGVINMILGGVETMVNGVISVINTILGAISSVASVFSELLGFGSVDLRIPTVRIPRLAAGAVIPPNREFLAVLGDQSSGNNIEAPEALLRQMAAEAAAPNTELLREILQAVRAGQTIEVDRQPFGRVVRDAYDRESARAGTSFVQVT